MSDPVVPPAGAQSFPPPNAGGPAQPVAYPAPNAGGEYPQPNAGAPGYPAPGTPGYPPPGSPGLNPPGAVPPAPEEKSKGKVLKIVGGVVVAIVVIALKLGAVAGVRALFHEDPTGDAKVGDCVTVGDDLNETSAEVDAKQVDCASADAQFVILSRIEGDTNVDGTGCDATFETGLKEGEEGAIVASYEGDGYLLCLKTKA
ncbi:hypothetical protein [Actinoplanes sp. NPDC051851]|uniref:LppU/SCO3897 family protein n=1 Tax=Actinoplanes sp. NPDC051851 TaxID=3154753 RepID=UPI00344800C8